MFMGVYYDVCDWVWNTNNYTLHCLYFWCVFTFIWAFYLYLQLAHFPHFLSHLRSSIMPIRVVTASAVAFRALTISRALASLSSSSLNLFSYGPVKPVVWISRARSVRDFVLAARSWTMRSQSPKHWWHGWQSGKVPEKPRAHWSQRTPDTPCWHTQWPVTRLHWDVSMPRGSQSQAVEVEINHWSTIITGQCLQIPAVEQWHSKNRGPT